MIIKQFLIAIELQFISSVYNELLASLELETEFYQLNPLEILPKQLYSDDNDWLYNLYFAISEFILPGIWSI